MAKYNAAKHRIETDDGRVLATLTEHVETSKAWEVADWWGGDADVLEDLESEVTNAEHNKEEARRAEDQALTELRETEYALDRAKLKIEDLEAEIEKLKAQLEEKGAPIA